MQVEWIGKAAGRDCRFAAAMMIAAALTGFPAHAETPSAALTRASVKPDAAAPVVQPAALRPASAAAPAVTAPAPVCRVTREFAHFDKPLGRTTRSLAQRHALKIVAIGSSSTAGAGASSAKASYPSRLAFELQKLLPGQAVEVLNLGINGEDAAEMVKRFKTVVDAGPDLVLWQVGTNAVLRDRPLGPSQTLIRDGLAQLKVTGADIVVIDPQYAPKVLNRHDAAGMVELIANAAKEANVVLFRRFDLMRRWKQTEGLQYDAFLSSDSLHMNDWSYACLAKILGTAIAEAAQPQVATATAAAAPALIKPSP